MKRLTHRPARRPRRSGLPRRRVLGGAVLLGAGATGLTALAACGDDNGEPGDRDLRFAWWGNPTRDELTEAAVAMFTEDTGRGVETEPSNWDDHWDSLSTQVAGGNPPDLMQHDYQFLGDYVRNNSLLALDDYADNPLPLDQMPPDTLDSGRIDGSLYAVSMGYNTFALISNQGVLADAGEEQPDDTLTWSEFFDLAVRIGENTEDGVWGTSNAIGLKEPFECWLHQQGKALYTADGQLAFDAADYQEWLDFWMELVEAGGCPDAEFTSELSGALEDSEVATGRGAFLFHWSNIVPAVAGLVEGAGATAGVSMYPQGDGGAPNGQYYKASMYLAVPADAADPDGAVDLMHALIFDPDIAASLGLERGVPSAEPVREAVTPELGDAELLSLEFVERVAGQVGDVPPPPPPAGPEFDAEFQFFAEEVGFGNLSSAEAAEQFIDTAQNILA